MNPVYVYGGFILTAGTLDNGNSWQGVNIMLAEVKPTSDGGYTSPMVAYVYKASRSDSIMDFLNNTPLGEFVHVYFTAPDSKGKSRICALRSL